MINKKTVFVLLFIGLLSVLSGLFVIVPVSIQQYKADKMIEEQVHPINLQSRGVDVNTDNFEELITLHGIGQRTASLWIEEKNKNGRFYYPEDIMAIRGIGRNKLNKIVDELGF